MCKYCSAAAAADQKCVGNKPSNPPTFLLSFTLSGNYSTAQCMSALQKYQASGLSVPLLHAGLLNPSPPVEQNFAGKILSVMVESMVQSEHFFFHHAMWTLLISTLNNGRNATFAIFLKGFMFAAIHGCCKT